MATIPFTKMHGLGNDYVYFDCLRNPDLVPEPARVAPRLSDRHTGIGGDGIVLILPDAEADVRMRMFNADGSEAQMCGNAIRCVAKYVYDRGYTRQETLRIRTGRGILSLALSVAGGVLRLKLGKQDSNADFCAPEFAADFANCSFATDDKLPGDLVREGHIDHSIRTAIRFNTIDSAVALTIAFLINAAILVLAAVVFFGKDSVTVAGGAVVKFGPECDWIRIAHLTLAPLLGTTAASTLFAVALLASGQSSTITGTLAGQVVMEGFMRWRLRPWIRRMISRTIAIVPAIWIVSIRGTGSVTDLVNLSQVVLCLILPLAMFPLLHFTSSRQKMGQWANGWFLLILGWGSVLLITAMDLYSLPASLKEAWRIITGG